MTQFSPRPLQPGDEAPRPAEMAPSATTLPRVIEPMRPVTAREPFDSPAHVFEVLWEGVRAVAFKEDAGLRLQDMYGRDVTSRFPELADIREEVLGEKVALDGVIVALDEAGKPDFRRLAKRLAAWNGDDPAAAAGEFPVTYQAVDLLFRKGESTMNMTLRRRKEVLQQIVKTRRAVAFPDFVARDGVAFYEAARQHGLYGIIAKEWDSRYLPGKSSAAWVKIPQFRRGNFVVAGFTYGGPVRAGRPSRRENPIASLLLGAHDARGVLRYVGEVTGGESLNDDYTVRTIDELAARECPLTPEPAVERLVFWCRPELAATVRYAEWAPGPLLRFPVFECLRPDVPPAACVLEED